MLAAIDEVRTFSVGTMQADDITCLVIRRTPQPVPGQHRDCNCATAFDCPLWAFLLLHPAPNLS
jgi:hypothetical protein